MKDCKKEDMAILYFLFIIIVALEICPFVFDMSSRPLHVRINDTMSVFGLLLIGGLFAGMLINEK